MVVIGEIKGAIKIENGIMVLTLSEQERMRLIRRLAVSGETYIDDRGNMDVHFDLGVVKAGSEAEEEVEEELAKYEDPVKRVEPYLELVDDGGVDYDDVVDTSGDTGGRRSIDELSPEEKEFLVDLYINDFPTTVIMESENVTKSALYSSLERERIPRKGKLNTIIRRIKDGDELLEVSSEEDVDITVINRIVGTLSEGGELY